MSALITHSKATIAFWESSLQKYSGGPKPGTLMFAAAWATTPRPPPYPGLCFSPVKPPTPWCPASLLPSLPHKPLSPSQEERALIPDHATLLLSPFNGAQARSLGTVSPCHLINSAALGNRLLLGWPSLILESAATSAPAAGFWPSCSLCFFPYLITWPVLQGSAQLFPSWEVHWPPHPK